MRRRDVLIWLGAATACTACSGLGWAGETGEGSDFEPGRVDAIDVPPSKWKEVLTAEEYRILRQEGTERAFTSDLLKNKEDGIYVCAGCALPVYDSRTKFKSGTGWPSYYRAIGEDHVAEKSDRSLGMLRTELLCNRCGGHLGHVFPDGPPPTGMRHCINGVSLDFVPREHADKLGPVRMGGWDGPPDDAATTPSETPAGGSE